MSKGLSLEMGLKVVLKACHGCREQRSWLSLHKVVMLGYLRSKVRKTSRSFLLLRLL